MRASNKALMIYSAALCFFLLLYFPQVIRGKKYRNSFWQRLGFAAIQPPKKLSYRIWFHAVSVGETKAIALLAKKYFDEVPSCEIIITSITETGHYEAKRSIPFATHHLYLPFDFSRLMKAFIQKIQPDLLIFSETDFWPNLIRYAKKYGAKLVVVNGKLSERSAKRYRFLSSPFSQFDKICCQTQEEASRFTSLGVNSERIAITGNLKFDYLGEEHSDPFLDTWAGDDPVVVLGSTHHPEEELLLRVLLPNKRIKIVVVPRHPERFDAVSELLSNQSYVRYSKRSDSKTESRILLMDAMGLLKACYRISHVAIVGGSFVDHVGGHNILEPLEYGVPVLFGPHMEAQKEMVQFCLKYEAGCQVQLSEVPAKVDEFLTDQKLHTKLSLNGQRLLREQQGSLERTWRIIKKMHFEACHKNATLDIL